MSDLSVFAHSLLHSITHGTFPIYCRKNDVFTGVKFFLLLQNACSGGCVNHWVLLLISTISVYRAIIFLAAG